LTWYLTPTEEELFQKYSPELQRKSLERRYEKQKEFDDFVGRLKEYSKSDKPSKYCHMLRDPPVILMSLAVWTIQAEEAERERQARVQQSLKIADEVRARKEEMRKEAGLASDSSKK
jgi:hypothetical protein